MKFGQGRYRIGEIAARTRLTPDALRYYERLGLLPRFQRTAGGFRIYTSDVVERVRFIRQAQTIGLSLHEIRQLAGQLDRDDPERRPAVTDLLVSKLAEVDATLSELREFRRTLKGYLQNPGDLSLEHHQGA
jgi:MerR family mercuric resistance operon transcriptional regulator